MKRAAIQNLENPLEKNTVADHRATPQSPLTSEVKHTDTGMLDTISFTSFATLPNDICVTNLSNLDFNLGNSSSKVNMSINALKHIEIDRTSVTSSKKTQIVGDLKASSSKLNLLDTSDDEGAEPDSALLAHLVRDVSEVNFDDVDL